MVFIRNVQTNAKHDKNVKSTNGLTFFSGHTSHCSRSVQRWPAGNSRRRYAESDASWLEPLGKNYVKHLLDIHLVKMLSNRMHASQCQPCFASACSRVQKPSYLHSSNIYLQCQAEVRLSMTELSYNYVSGPWCAVNGERCIKQKSTKSGVSSIKHHISLCHLHG